MHCGRIFTQQITGSIAFCALISFASTCFASTPSTSVTTAYQARADAYLVRGAVVGIVTPAQSSSVLLGDGKSDRTLFEIGSISKSFTGIAAALFSVKKKLDLELPISNYIPELASSFIGKVTAHQLATHSACLVDAYTDSSGHATDNYSEMDLIFFLQNYKPDSQTQAPPCKRSYSNVGFATLGLVLSRIEKQSFHDIVQNVVLGPLAMSETGFILSPAAPAGLVQGYDVLLNPLLYNQFSDLEAAAGGIYSNLHDMMIYLNANLHPDSSSLGQAIQLSHQLGLGWDSDHGALPVWKNGAMIAGFSSYILFDPTPGKQTGAVVLTNVLNSSIAMGLGSIAFGLTDSFLLPQELNNIDPTLIQSVAGTYVNSDGTKTIQICPLMNNFLQATETQGSQSLSVRLFSYNSSLLFVDDGIEVADAIQIASAPGAQPIQLIYLEYQGPLANPQFKKIPLQQQSTSCKITTHVN